MSGAVLDARLNVGFFSHPKTKKVARRLGDKGVLKTIALILWTAGNRPNGDFIGMSDEDIELAVDWSGDADALVNALVDARFIDGQPGARRLHDWADHNGWAAGHEARSDRGSFAALVKRYGRDEAERLMPEYAALHPRKDGSKPAGAAKKPRARSAKKPASAAKQTGEQNQGEERAQLDDARSSATSTAEQCPVSDTVSVTDAVTDTDTDTVPNGEELSASAAPAARPASGRRPPKVPMPADFGVSDRVRRWAGSKGFDRLDEHLEVFQSKVRANGYRYTADGWDDALMSCIREDWGKLRDRRHGGSITGGGSGYVPMPGEI